MTKKSDLILVSNDEIIPSHLLEFVTDSRAGAISSFFGTTRDSFDDGSGPKTVLKLEYEGYVPMAIKVLQDLVTEIRAIYPSLIGVAIVHRLGPVAVKEISVGIAVSSPHRKESLDAVEWLIDTLKAKVPIWKREFYTDGSTWKENRCQGCH